MEKDINLQEIPKLVPILKKKTSRKKMICWKTKMKKMKMLENIRWMVKYYASLI
jgi:hypothetical protein